MIRLYPGAGMDLRRPLIYFQLPSVAVRLTIPWWLADPVEAVRLALSASGAPVLAAAAPTAFTAIATPHQGAQIAFLAAGPAWAKASPAHDRTGPSADPSTPPAAADEVPADRLPGEARPPWRT